jgi:hypothetical protein
MPTFILSTPTNPGTAAWTDSATIPGGFETQTTTIVVPGILAGDLFTTIVAGFTAPAGTPVIVGWGTTATVIKVWGHMPLANTVELIIEAANNQGFAGASLTFTISVQKL